MSLICLVAPSFYSSLAMAAMAAANTKSLRTDVEMPEQISQHRQQSQSHGASMGAHQAAAAAAAAAAAVAHQQSHRSLLDFHHFFRAAAASCAQPASANNATVGGYFQGEFCHSHF